MKRLMSSETRSVVRPTVMLALVVAMLLTYAIAVQARGRVPHEEMLAIAEGILGEGVIRYIYTTPRGALFIRWESKSYKAANDLAESRRLIYDEIMRATSALLEQVASLAWIHATVLEGSENLATGERARGGWLVVTFSMRLGGGQVR